VAEGASVASTVQWVVEPVGGDFSAEAEALSKLLSSQRQTAARPDDAKALSQAIKAVLCPRSTPSCVLFKRMATLKAARKIQAVSTLQRSMDASCSSARDVVQGKLRDSDDQVIGDGSGGDVCACGEGCNGSDLMMGASQDALSALLLRCGVVLGCVKTGQSSKPFVWCGAKLALKAVAVSSKHTESIVCMSLLFLFKDSRYV